MRLALEILSVFVLVLVNGFFVAAEFALVGVRRSRIKTLADAGSRRAKRLMGVLDSLNAYLSASQLGITLASLGLALVGEPAFSHLVDLLLGNLLPESARHIVAFLIAYSVITALHIVFGEQAPKLFGLDRAEKVALTTALPMQIFYFVFRIPIRLLDSASALAVRPFGIHATAEHASSYTADELRQIVEHSHRSGHLESGEQQMLARVFDFSDAEVREAMIPRTEVVALPMTATIDQAAELFAESGFSRLPVYRDQLDEIAGVLFLKELFPYLRDKSDREFDLASLLHTPMFVPATARLGNVLKQMQAARTHIAFVVDEHGGIEGILTLEDLLEEIVGEINDEYDEEVRSQIVEEGGTFVLDGMLAMRDINRHFDLDLPEDAGYTTLAGFLLDQAGRILQAGDSIEHEGATFVVESVEHRRIRRVRYTPASKLIEEADMQQTIA